MHYIWYCLFNSHDYKKVKYNPKLKNIILLHGSGYNHSEWIIGRLYLNCNVFSFNYAGLFSNLPNDGIEDYANGIVREKINEISKLINHKDFTIIGHSMGGLIASYYMAHLAPLDGIKIDKVISIGTPWKGSYLSQFLKAKRYKQMTSNSKFLSDLSNSCADLPIYSIGGPDDWAVAYNNSIFNSNHHVNVTYHGHYALIVSPIVWYYANKIVDKD